MPSLRGAIDTIKGYFSSMDETAEDSESALKKVYKKRKKKKKKIPAGSYSKSARKEYERALKEAEDY